MNETYQITMDKMVSGGDCLGRLPDGRAVFVPFVLPGETVRLQIIEDKKRFARAWPLELIEVSPDRITPRCTHFGTCGGCQYQNLDYTKQLELKETLMVDQFQRIARLDDPPIQPVVPSPDPWNYRNYIQFQLSRDGALGFIHANKEFLLPIRECHLPSPPINDLWPQLDLGPDSTVYRLGIRADTCGDIMLIMEGEDPTPPEFSVDIPISAVYAPPDSKLTVLAGGDHLTFNVLDYNFQVSARSFFQVNTAMAEKMVRFLLETLDLSGGSQVIELYAGVGLFSAFLAPRVSRLIAVESSGSACYDFIVNLVMFDNVSLYEAEAEEVLPSLDMKADILIADPPRAGLAPQVHDALETVQPRQIAYVSCDPATLARDTRKIIEKGYRLDSVTPFDLFPQTGHVESITLLSRIES